MESDLVLLIVIPIMQMGSTIISLTPVFMAVALNFHIGFE